MGGTAPKKRTVISSQGLLKLNCDKALMLIDWKSILGFEDTLRFTIEWYKDFKILNIV